MITYPPNTDLYIENRLGEAAIWWFTEAPWRRGVVVITTAHMHQSLNSGSAQVQILLVARWIFETIFSDNEWSRLEIRLNAFCRSTNHKSKSVRTQSNIYNGDSWRIKAVSSWQKLLIFPKKTPLQIFDWVLNTILVY